MKKRVATLLMILIAILWGFGYISCEFAYDANWSVFAILVIRCLSGFLICFLITIKAKTWKNKKLVKDGLIAGVLFFSGYAFQLYGQKYTTIANTCLLTAAGIILVPFFSWLIYKKKPSIPASIACIVAVIGSFVLSYQPNFKFNSGDIFCIIGSLCFSLHLAFLDHVANNHHPVQLVTYQFLSMFVLSLAGLLISGSALMGNLENTIGWLGVIYYALISGVACFIMQAWSQRHVEPAITGLILSLEGIFGTLFGIILFREQHLTLQITIGGLIMLSALIISQLPQKKQKKEV